MKDEFFQNLFTDPVCENEDVQLLSTSPAAKQLTEEEKWDVLSTTKIIEPHKETLNLELTSGTNQRLRWGKKQDKELFKNIRILEKQGVTSLNEIIHMNAETEAETHSGVAQLVTSLNWKSSPKHLVYRVQKQMSYDFSIREVKLLKKQLKRSHYNSIDYDTLIYDYPGKTMKRLKQVCEKLIECRWKRNLHVVDVNTI